MKMSRTMKSNKVTTMKSVLHNLHLQQYLPTFQRHDIDLKKFLTLNEQTLKSIGIINDSHRKVLIICSRKLSQLLLTTTITNGETDPNLQMETLDEVKDDSIEQHLIQSNLSTHLLMPITEEEEPYLPSLLQPTDDDSVISVEGDAVDQSPDPIIPVSRDISSMPPRYTLEPQETITFDDTESNNDSRTNSLPASVSRPQIYDGTDNSTKKSLGKDLSWRHSMPTYNGSELPSYFDVVDRQCGPKSIVACEEEGHEDLPVYSCSVFKKGYIIKKSEMTAHGIKARDRSWRKIYLYLWGTFIRIYKSEPIDINHVEPIQEFSMDKAQIGLASDYSKRRNVFRIRTSTGHQFLFQTVDRDDCVSWIEKLQSSVNISSTIDDREMPMFITLPTRRRRGGTLSSIGILSRSNRSSSGLFRGRSISSTMTSNSNNLGSDARDNGVALSYALTTATTTGLTYQHFNDIARELQQVQIVDILSTQQLIW